MLGFDAPAQAQERTEKDVLLGIESAIKQMQEDNAPGVRGIEGTEAIPELVLRSFTVRERFQVTANRRRKKLTIKCLSGSCELRESTGLELPGWKLVEGESLTIDNSTNAVFIVPPTDGQAVVQTCEESS